ncbi:MAG TPA: hypothetical protein VI386_27795 [Candidatus Sulfotelmatobacter sp.]
MKQKKMKRQEPIKIPLDFKQTVQAALETKPERRKTPKKRKGK